MAKTYCTCQGMRGEATRCGGNDGVRVSAQSYDGSIIVYNWYDGDQLMVEVGTSDGSRSGSINGPEFRGSFDEFKSLLKLAADIKSGKVSVVRHRRK